MFPRRLLTNHFWTEEQRIEFQEKELGDRFKYYETLSCCLQEKKRLLRKHAKFHEYENVLFKLRHGSHPTPTELLDAKEIFADSTFNLITLSRKHIVRNIYFFIIMKINL